MICTPMRSGGTFLADCLLLTGGFGWSAEWLHERAVLKNLQFPEAVCREHYLQQIQSVQEKKRDGVQSYKIDWRVFSRVCAKLFKVDSPHDLRFPSPDFSKVFPDVRFVFLERSNLFAQAISLYKAEKSVQWAKRDNASPKAVVDLDIEHVKRAYLTLRNEYRHWLEFFPAANTDYLHLTYEDMSKQPHETIQRVGRFVEVGPCEPKLLNNLFIQRDTVSAEWENFTREIARQEGW